MSNYLAIATLTATLRDMLEGALPSKLGALVKTQHPSKVDAGETAVNLYMYHVAPNGARRNEDLPTRSGEQIMRQPRLALDVHYLLSCYGDEKLMLPQRLLGAAMSALHAHPFLDQKTITRAVADPKRDYLAGSDFERAVKEVRITPLSMDPEAFGRTWSGLFPSVPYPLSVLYRASVVMIDAGLTPDAPPAVEDRAIHAGPSPRRR